MVHALGRVAQQARRGVRLVIAQALAEAPVIGSSATGHTSALAPPLPQTLAEHPVDTPPAAASSAHPR